MDSTIMEQVVKIKNIELAEKWISIEQGNKVGGICDYILTLLNIEDLNEAINGDLVKSCTYFHLNIQRLWNKCSRNRILFKKRHQVWLDSEFRLPEKINNMSKYVVTEQVATGSRGRPKKSFQDSSQKTKRRRVETLLQSWQPEDLNYAAKISANLTVRNIKNVRSSLPPQEVLALYFDLDLSERKYNLLRRTVNATHENCFPSLYALKELKKTFLPMNNTITETTAYVDLQELLNKTAESIVNIINIEKNTTSTLICKWGFDGSSGHSIYKQKFVDPANTDEFLFLIAFCPLKLIDNENNKELWKNPHPSSTLYCRAIKFMFIKESRTVITNEEMAMSKLINELRQHSILKNDCKIDISYKMLLTMIDGSVSNILSGTNSASKCFICGSSPKEMNNTGAISNKTPKQENYRFGISPLHCWI